MIARTLSLTISAADADQQHDVGQRDHEIEQVERDRSRVNSQTPAAVPTMPPPSSIIASGMIDARFAANS